MKICVCTYVSGGGRSLWHIILENRTKMYAFASILVASGFRNLGNKLRIPEFQKMRGTGPTRSHDGCVCH